MVREECDNLIAKLRALHSIEKSAQFEIGMYLYALKAFAKPKGLSWATFLKDMELPWGARRADEYIRVFEGKTTVLEIQEKKRQSVVKTRSNRADQALRSARPTIETKRKNGATHGDTVRSACAINWENHREDDGESDAVVRARAVEWQLHEAERLANEFALRRPGTQRSEIKPALKRKIGKVIAAWRRLQKEMQAKQGGPKWRS
jgi:hypothetical protein